MTSPLEVAPEELARLRREAPTEIAVVDVRDPDEVAICALDGAILAPLSTFPGAAAAFPNDRRLIVVCHHGMRSLRAAMWLRENGFADAASLRGGLDAWAREIDPDMRTY